MLAYRRLGVLLKPLNKCNDLETKASHHFTSLVLYSLPRVPPSLELETLFKCYMAYTTFVSGSALKWEDLRRVAVRTSCFFF